MNQLPLVASLPNPTTMARPMATSPCGGPPKGPTPFAKGQWVITDDSAIGRVTHVGGEALSIRVWVQDPEGYLTPTATYTAHVLQRVQLLKVISTNRGKKLVVGPSEGSPPLLKHYKLLGRGLNKCESKHFYKALQRAPPKAQREKLTQLCEFWSHHVGWPFKPSTMAKLKAKSSKLLLLHQEAWVHTKVLHKAHMVGSHQHGPAAQHECQICHVLDTHEHAFTQCAMAASVWQGLLEWTHPVWKSEKMATPTPSVALCMLGLMQASTLTYPPRWWQLLQRITLRWIWAPHAQRLYGDDMIYGDPSTMISHIQSEFEGRIKWDFAKAQRQHERAQHRGTKRRLSVKFKQRWGCMVQFDNQGKTVSLVLNTEPG